MQSNECKFCTLHKYGVFILNASGLFVLLMVIIVYRKELLAFFRGKYKPVERNQLSPLAKSQPGGSIAQNFSSNIQKNDTYAHLPNEQSAQSQQETQQPPTQAPPEIEIQPPSLVRTPATPQPISQPKPPSSQEQQPQQQEQQQQQLQPVVIHLKKVLPVRIKQPTNVPAVVSTNSPTTLPAAKSSTPNNDPFRLPKPELPISDHESTGSDYFKQMLKGKKPVASISQYAHIKRSKKQKRGGRHHHKDKKRN